MRNAKLLIVFLLLIAQIFAQTNSLQDRLEQLQGIRIEKLEPDSGFTEKYRLFVRQELDHQHPGAGTFEQQVILSHHDFNSTTVIITEGYSIRGNIPNLRELSELLEANEVQVEYRYHGKSLPDSMIWKYLTIQQAAADHHHIRELLGKIYSGPWVATGFSKGGQTTICYRYFYPGDVVVSVPYVAPLNFSQREPRVDAFFDHVGSAEIRRKLIEMQRMTLRRKSELLPRFHWYAVGRGYHYSIGEEKALEYVALEYPFSFWQYHHFTINDIPDSSSDADRILDHLRKVVSFYSYSDASMNDPSMYQFMTQLGYYGYVQKNVKDLLSDPGNYPNSAFAPQDVSLEYDPEPMEKISHWLQKEGNNFIYIYGENDPWGATRVVLSKDVNSKLFELEKGNHLSYIRDFPMSTQKEIINRIKLWLNMN